MSDFDLTIAERDGVVQVSLRGELDISTTTRLEEDLERVEADEPSLIVIDLRGLVFMDSTGLRLLIATEERSRAAGRRLVLVRGNPLIQRVLKLTRLDDQIEMVDDPSEVLGAV